MFGLRPPGRISRNSCSIAGHERFATGALMAAGGLKMPSFAGVGQPARCAPNDQLDRHFAGSSTLSLANTSATTSSAARPARSAPRASQSRLRNWSDSTTPLTPFTPINSTSKG